MRIISAIILLIIPGIVSVPGIMAQNLQRQEFDEFRTRKKAEFEQFQKEKHTEFEMYRARLNEEYAVLLSGKWNLYKEQPKQERQAKPKPVRPLTADKEAPVKPRNLQVSAVIPSQRPIPDIPVTIPNPQKNKRKKYPVNFTFYNTPCGIDRFDTSLLSVTSLSGKSLSNAWTKLTQNDRLEPLLNDCLRLREEMSLCDWGFLKLVDKVAHTLYPQSADNSTFLATALMNQAGYNCRLITKNDRLALAFHPSHTIYGTSYTMIEGKRYYIYGPLANEKGDIHTYPGDFRKSPTPLRMIVDRFPNFTTDKKSEKTYNSANWKSAPPFELTVNSSAMKFFDEYPVVDWNVYGVSAVSPDLRFTLFEAMRILTEGMTEEEAVNLLLSFHNYGFKYMTDGNQFGREKPFFCDENFYYPYNDCEDRAIMFARLVKTVLGLEAVYLEFPQHLAAAVRFSPGVMITGTTVSVDGDTYVVCDPTCIGGRAGYLPPEFAGSSPKIHKILLR